MNSARFSRGLLFIDYAPGWSWPGGEFNCFRFNFLDYAAERNYEIEVVKCFLKSDERRRIRLDGELKKRDTSGNQESTCLASFSPSNWPFDAVRSIFFYRIAVLRLGPIFIAHGPPTKRSIERGSCYIFHFPLVQVLVRFL